MLDFPAWKRILVLVVCLLGLAYAAPNFFPKGSFDFLTGGEAGSPLPGKQLSLGLDLQGGSHLLLHADTAVVVREQFDSVEDLVRQELLRDARIRMTETPRVRGDAVTFKLRDQGENDRARSLLREADPRLLVDIVDDGQFVITLPEDELLQIRENALVQAVEVIRRRVDELGTTEPLIQQQGQDRILVQVPGFDEPERLKQLIGKTAKLTFHLVDSSVAASQVTPGREPPGTILLPSDDLDGSGRAINFVVKRRVVVSGENLVDAQPSFQDGRPVVSFRFDAIGGKRFGDVTSDNVGQLLAIVLDGKVISAPRIQTAIVGGSGIITGQFTVQAVTDLALLLRAGALPADLTVLEERTVGPGLGQDSIDAGKIASIIGMVGVIVFMVITYGLFGVMADVALLINMVLILAVLSALQATLTLPGIAGIVLTIGMAVDANVLIFERIREELRNGRTPISAVDAGYRRALTTIVDANLTTLIAAVFLFAFGSGPIKGFAVTLTVGIVTSMFTAIMLTRFIVVMWLRRTRPAVLPI